MTTPTCVILSMLEKPSGCENWDENYCNVVNKVTVSAYDCDYNPYVRKYCKKTCGKCEGLCEDKIPLKKSSNKLRMKALVGWDILFQVPELINVIVFFTRIKNDMDKEDKTAWDLN